MTMLADIPSFPHYAIVGETSIYIPGDERSRTNPGHGYPETTERCITYRAFIDRAKWEEEVGKAFARGERFRAVSVVPAEVTTTLTVKIGD